MNDFVLRRQSIIGRGIVKQTIIGEPLEHPYYWKFKYNIVTSSPNGVKIKMLTPKTSTQLLSKFSKAIIIDEENNETVFDNTSDNNVYNDQAFDEIHITLLEGSYTVYYLPIPYSGYTDSAIVTTDYSGRVVDNETYDGDAVVRTIYLRPPIDYHSRFDNSGNVVNGSHTPLFYANNYTEYIDFPVPFDYIKSIKNVSCKSIKQLRVPNNDLDKYINYFKTKTYYDDNVYIPDLITGYDFTCINEDNTY